jgi:hypothetical protein
LSNQAALEGALAYHQAGRLPEAERILASEPSHADALHLLDVAAHQNGEHGRAVMFHIPSDDEANLEPDTGGLVLWNKAVPDGYFSTTAEEMVQMEKALVAEPDAEHGYVAYGCNRAMFFRSNVLHKTHRVNFKDAYPHRRVSITFLYGKPGQ